MNANDNSDRKLLPQISIRSLLTLLLLFAFITILIVQQQGMLRLETQLHDMKSRIEIRERIREVELSNERLRRDTQRSLEELKELSTATTDRTAGVQHCGLAIGHHSGRDR